MASAIIENLKKQYQGKKILVVGLGLQGGGVGVARFFGEIGAHVKVTDKKTKEELQASIDKLKDLDIDYTLGSHDLKDFLDADVIFKGPSIPWDMPEIKEAEKKGIPIEMEISFFLSVISSKNVIGITGTRGKSTTTMMIYELLKNTGVKVKLGGNIPDISTISYLKDHKEDTWYVLELASWPLSGFNRRKISPHISILTNFYSDHLNYYKNMDDYLRDKKAIYLYQKPEDYLIFNTNFKNLIKENEVKSKIIYFSDKNFPEKLNFLQGTHNLENADAALKVSEIMNIPKDKTIDIIKNYKGLPYRQEVIAQEDGVIFVNDTTSTTPVATTTALKTFVDSPVILLLGGKSKNLPYDELIRDLDKPKEIVLLKGNFTDEILPILQTKYPNKIHGIYETLEEAITVAYSLSQKYKKDNAKVYILFSPGATSFATFLNEFHRGREFNRIVTTLLKRN